MKEKKTIFTFIVILAGSLLLGFLTGVWSGRINGMLEALDTTRIINALSIGFAILFVLFHLIVCGISFALYRNVRKAYDQRTENDEEIYEQVEYKMDLPLLLGNLAIILSLVLFGVIVYLYKKCTLEVMLSKALLIISLIVFIFGYVWVIVLQNKLVNLCKEISPEKKGNILDTKFQKEWMESCDEAQRTMIYQSAYKAFNAANAACLVCWVFSFLGMLLFDTGILAVIMVGAVYLTLIMSYTVAAMKQEKPYTEGGKL